VLRDQLAPTLKLAVPVILAELGWMGMGLVDTLMVAPLGPAAIAATAVGNSLHLGFAIFGMGLLLGLDTLVAQAYGAGERALCRRWLTTGLRLALVTTVPMMVLLGGLWWLSPSLGFHPETQPLLQGYLGILLLSTPALFLYAALRRYLQSIGHVTAVMVTLLTANLVNFVANWALIHGHLGLPALGVTGAAWATVTARVYMVAALALIVWLSDRHVPAATATTPAAPMKRLLSLGLPAASTVTAEVGIFSLLTALAGQLAPVSTAAHQIALNMAAMVFMVHLGLASAGAIRVGHAIGARNFTDARHAGWTVIAMSVSLSLVTGTVFLTFPEALISVYTTEPEVVQLASQLLAIAALFQIFDGLQGVTTGTLRGLGDTRTAMVSNLTAFWLIGAPVSYGLCFGLGWGAPGLWWGLLLGLALTSLVLLWVWTRTVRQRALGR
jgi:MATE family multidrug resistance protein